VKILCGKHFSRLFVRLSNTLLVTCIFRLLFLLFFETGFALAFFFEIFCISVFLADWIAQ
jgi:hypothetical protein